MRVRSKVAAVALATACIGGVTTTASAATGGATVTPDTVSSIGGTVNCSGSWVYYNTTRHLRGYSSTYLYVTKAAWSSGHWWTGGADYHDGFGVRIYKSTGAHVTNLYSSTPGANQYATFNTTPYMPTTAFKMMARMDASSGTCHNSWAGTLTY